ncbi:15-hydroxyprostaglandin dehydrogenase [NAD(+)]-like [Pomacea canaliculata]|uniref:15-hydroxyprostaglandin dehydrogenase [NAD(+)]-like n=1 Tax=Pomacea canaliculata TaxID=400727 RepID=UPI000D738265|nr:15-hydroxyprostaglandin dehydrogenase [NAD(+)]-like [Pomacea canaliculata]XP_025078024.1 15-hydroxyprostaglandin dehydrogenase [NAD(+)]-like [Pomacea canaliculata]
MEIAGKGVFLTGGARGIGRKIIEALLANGARVLFCDIDESVGRETESELRKQYGDDRVIFQQCDVTKADQLKATFDMAVSNFGAVDVCCNNAGIMDESVPEKMIAINTTAQIRGSQLALEHMRRDRGGRGGVIVSTVSMGGLISSCVAPVYVASKHAMIGYMQSMAFSVYQKEQGVRWISLCPFGVNTNFISPKEEQVIDKDVFLATLDVFGVIELEDVAGAFMRLLQNENNNGAIMEVSPQFKAGRYLKRMLVDEDGISDPVPADKPLILEELAAAKLGKAT